MGAPLSEWRQRIQDLLEDGEWHEQEPVVRDAMRFVPPGRAYRHAEYARTRGKDAPRQRGDQSDAIAAGQRQIAMQSVHAAIRTGKFERRKQDGVTYIRLVGGPVHQGSEADQLAEELRKQYQLWKKAEFLLSKKIKENILGEVPEQSIVETLKRLGRW